jgi:hypothetical protein
MTLFDLRGLIAALDEGESRYVVIGGVAVAAHGFIRATEDLDLVPDPDQENLDTIVNVLIRHGGRLTLNPDCELDADVRRALYQGRNVSVTTALGDVDIVQLLPGVGGYADLAARATREMVFGATVLICSREDLIAMKRARATPLDMADVEYLAG